MNLRRHIVTFPLLLSLAGSVSAQGITFYESGDFSDNLGSPTPVTPALGAGSNQVIGDTRDGLYSSDTDVFSVVLPSGLTISSISITVSNYIDNTPSDPSRFEILFAANGNYGSVFFNGDGIHTLSFTLGAPSNIAFRINSGEDWMSGTYDTFDYTATLVISAAEPGYQYCPGDGSWSMCPCANTNDGSMSGCDWQGGGGAGGTLSATGSNDLSADDAILTATNVTANFGVFFAGNNQPTGTLNDGLRCAGGGAVRLIPPTNPGSSTHVLPASVQSLDAGAVLGATRNYQYWFRTPAGPCGYTANTTNGYSITW